MEGMLYYQKLVKGFEKIVSSNNKGHIKLDICGRTFFSFWLHQMANLSEL